MKQLFILISIFTFTLACGESGNKIAKVDNLGSDIFTKNCVLCHGIDGKLGNYGAKDLSKSILTLAERKVIITNGRGAMTPFEGILTDKEIEAVAKFTMEKFKE